MTGAQASEGQMSAPKITKNDILDASRGMLQKPLYAVFTEPTAGMGPVMANIEAHLAFQVALEQKGIMFAAGPFWADDETTWNGEGMVLIRADSLAHARQIAQIDPMHSSGARRFTVRPWLLNEGRMTIAVDYSTGNYAIT